MSDRVKKLIPNYGFNPHQLSIGTAIPGHADYDPDNIFNSTSGLNMTTAGMDYDPFYPMRGFQVHGAQSGKTVKVQFINGSTITYDNLVVTATDAENDGGWLEVKDMQIVKILKSGTTATGVFPIF
jgi:hypothetical protein